MRGDGRAFALPPALLSEPRLRFPSNPRGWRFKKKGFFVRAAPPTASSGTAVRSAAGPSVHRPSRLTYWLRRPDLPRKLFLRLLACSAYRQIARDLGVSPTTVLRQVERLGRHCLLFHERLRPKRAPREPLVVDGFETFEFSQYTPVHFHTAVGADSHFVYGFTDSELRRKGRMTRAAAAAPRRSSSSASAAPIRARSSARWRRSSSSSSRRAPPSRIHSDEHPAYPRAVRAAARSRPRPRDDALDGAAHARRTRSSR